jgi:molybdopterin-containing oxidoreductase family membrane subunit
MLATGMIVCYGYFCEVFYAYYSGAPYELQLMRSRLHGPYAFLYFSLWFCNFIAIQPLWSPAARKNTKLVWWICIIVSIGMWLERFVIIPMSLHRDFLPSSSHLYRPTFWDFSMFFGTIGFFIFMMWLFIRFMPAINIFEMKDLLYKLRLSVRHEEKNAQKPTGGGTHE